MSLQNDIKGLAKDSAIYGLSSGLSRIIGLVMAPILTRIFSPSDYGIISLIQVAISFLIILASMNIMSGMSYYYFKEDDEIKRPIVLTTGFLITIGLAALMGIILFTFAGQLASILQIRSEGPIEGHNLMLYLKIASITLFLSIVLSGAQTIVRLLKRPIDFQKSK